MLPRLTIEGRLTADPDLRFTPGGKAVATFTVAASDRKRGEDGSWEDGDKVFLRTTVWEQQAENVAECLQKGDAVVVTGAKLRQSEWEDKEGNKRTTYELTGNTITVAVPLRFNEVKINRIKRDKPAEKKQGPSDDVWALGDKDDDPPF